MRFFYRVCIWCADQVPLRAGTFRYYSWKGVWCLCCMKTHLWVGMLAFIELARKWWTHWRFTLSEFHTADFFWKRIYCPDRAEKEVAAHTNLWIFVTQLLVTHLMKSQPLPGLLMIQPPVQVATELLTWEAMRWFACLDKHIPAEPQVPTLWPVVLVTKSARAIISVELVCWDLLS